MGTNFSQQTMQTSITEHEYRVEALQKRIKELENENQKLKDNYFQPEIIAFGTHLSAKYGMTINENQKLKDNGDI